MLVSKGVLLIALAATFPGAAQAAAPAPPQPAHWVKKKINFSYLGFTTHYSCEGLTDTVRYVLLELGARKSDLNVHEFACTARLGEPTPFPGVAGTFYVLEPLAPEQATRPSGTEGIVPAHWQPVDVRFHRLETGEGMSGQCELLEQVKQHILPLFAARNVQFKSLCVPHELFAGGTSLKVEVLVPDKGSAGPTGSPGPAG